MATLYRTANPTHPRLSRLATLGRFHPEACGVGAILRRSIAIRPVCPRTRQIPLVHTSNRRLRRRRFDDQRLQHGLGLYTIVGISARDDGSQRHAVSVARYVDGCATLTAIHR